MICRQLSSVRKISLSLRVVARKNPGEFRSIRGGALSKLQQNDEERNQMQEYLALEEQSRSQFRPISEEDESRELGPTEQDQGYGYGFDPYENKYFNGSSDQTHFIFEINVGKRRIRHTPTLKLNDEFLDRFKIV